MLYEVIEAQLCDTAMRINQVRRKWIQEFIPIFTKYYQSIVSTNEIVSISYNSHLNNNAVMQAVLDENRERDYILGYTSRGIHRDDLEFSLSGHSLKKSGSQGQCKSDVIALKLAQDDFLKMTSGLTPLLLLDDIFDKLDANRVENIISLVSKSDFGQIFITDTNRTHLNEIVAKIGGEFNMYNVKDGAIALIESGGRE